MVLHGVTCMVLHGVAWGCVGLHEGARGVHGGAWRFVVLCGAARCCMVLHGGAWCCMGVHGI